MGKTQSAGNRGELFRDARIFSIYEGTTQLQVVAAIRYITKGTYLST